MRQDASEGRLTPSALQKLATIVGEKELREASGGAAVRRVQQVLACAGELEDALLERTERKDTAAPLAALALLNANRGKPRSWRSHLDSTNPDWRAVAVRTLTEPDESRKRCAAMLDPFQQVRYAAVQASEYVAQQRKQGEQSLDEHERRALIEVMRLDPFVSARTLAARAIGWSATDTELRVMRDVWSSAPEAVRQSMVAAWSFPNTLETGGLDLIQWAAQTDSSLPAIVAGGILIRLGGDNRGIGIAALQRGVSNGVGSARTLAISMAPLSEPDLLEQIQKLADDPDPKNQLAALTKLATFTAPATTTVTTSESNVENGNDPTKTQKNAREKLGQIAVSHLPHAADARVAMARIKDRRVLRLLLEQAKSTDKALRITTMNAMVTVGDPQRAAFFLADPDADVRMNTACRLLSSPL